MCAQEEGLTHTSVCSTVDHYKKSISRAVTHILNPGFTQRAHGRRTASAGLRRFKLFLKTVNMAVAEAVMPALISFPSLKGLDNVSREHLSMAHCGNSSVLS